MSVKSKILENIHLAKTRSSYIGSVDGILKGAGWWNEELYKLMGMTGMAFHFIIHTQACISSATVYDWQTEHLTMMDRIGIHSEVFNIWNYSFLNTAERIREDAVARIKESVERGLAVVIWAPTPLLEFGVITGYDDYDEVFFVQDCVDDDPDPLLYRNLGKSEVPALFYQIFKGRAPVDKEKVFRDSLEFGVAEWKKDSHINPFYAGGKKAYEYLVSTLKKGDFQEFGLTYLMSMYAEFKECIARYLKFIGDTSLELTGIQGGIAPYRKVADNFRRVTELIPFKGAEEPEKAHPRATGLVNRDRIPEVIGLITECSQLEAEAMAIIESAL